MSTRDRINQLEKAITDSIGDEPCKRSKVWCVPTFVWVGVLVPLIAFVMLMFTSPGFVMVTENGEKKRNMRKVIFWTVIFSAVGLGIMTVYWYVANGKNLMSCFSS